MIHSGKASLRTLLSVGGVLTIVALTACGEEQETKTVTVERPAIAQSDQIPDQPKRRPAPRSEPAPPAERWVRCDPNIEALAGTTTCEFAQNTFWSYWTSGEGSSLEVWSPAAQASFSTTCSADGGKVDCVASDDGEVRFAQAAVGVYSQAQADSYADGHDLGPDPYEGMSHRPKVPADPVEPAVPDELDPPDDDYDYDGDPTPPGENIPNYDEGDGYRVQCDDGTYSQSGGIQGACSHHGGVAD